MADTTDPVPDQAQGDLELASELRIALMRLTRRLRAEKSDESLTLTQLSALSSVWLHGPLSPTALAERERVQPPSMTRVITALEEHGLVERAPHPSDRRQAVIALTASGKTLLEADRARRNAWLARIISTLSDDERSALRAAAPIIERIGNT